MVGFTCLFRFFFTLAFFLIDFFDFDLVLLLYGFGFDFDLFTWVELSGYTRGFLFMVESFSFFFI